MFGLPYFGGIEIDRALRCMGGPSLCEKPQAVHPFGTQHDGGHGWSGPRGGKKRDKHSRQSERSARKAQRSNR